MAAVAACVRSVTPSLPSRLLMCVFTVASEISSSVRNLLVALAVHNLLQHVELPRRQIFCAHALGKLLGNRRRNVRFARMNRADGRDQLLRGHALQQIGPRPGLQRAIDILIAVVGGQHDEPRVRRLHANALDHVHAAHPRQPQVDQRDVRLVLAKLRDGLHAVRCLAHHLKALHHVQQRNQSLAHHVVVLDNQHANRFLCHCCSFTALASFANTSVPRPPVSRMAGNHESRSALRSHNPQPHRRSHRLLARHFERSANRRRPLSHSGQPIVSRRRFRLARPRQTRAHRRALPAQSRSAHTPTEQTNASPRRASSHYGWPPAPRAEFRAPSPAGSGR